MEQDNPRPSEADIQQAYDDCDMEAYESLLCAAFEYDKSLSTLNRLFEFYVELGRVEEASAISTMLLQADPNGTVTFWLYKAQIASGIQALSCYERALSLIQTPSKETASIFCAIAELHMTDLCDNEGAEKHCEEALRKALDLNEDAVDVLVAISNLRLVQGRRDESSVYCQRLLSNFKTKETFNDESYEIRFSVAKLFVEMQHYTDACDLLEYLLHENDSDMEVWLTTAIAYSFIDKSVAQEYCSKIRGFLDKQQDPDLADLLDAVEKQMVQESRA